MAIEATSGFRALLLRRGVVRPHYGSSMEAIAAVDLFQTIERLGDKILDLSGTGLLADDDAEKLFEQLFQCYTAPLERAGQISRLALEVNEIQP